MSEQRMSETVTVGSFTDGADPVTGDPTRVPVHTTYPAEGGDGRARIKYESLSVSEQDSAGSPVAIQTPVLSIPSGSPIPAEGEEVLCSASDADQSLVGRTFKIAGFPEAGQTTSLRFPLTENS
jgi:hypothetical protein